MKTVLINNFVEEETSLSDDLYVVATSYQNIFKAWSLEIDQDRREHWRNLLRPHLEQLWKLLEDKLVEVACGLLWTGMAQDLLTNPDSYPFLSDVHNALAVNLFYHVIDRLPKLPIDPNKNLLGLLLVAARRGFLTENRRIYHKIVRYSIRKKSSRAPTSGDREEALSSERSSTASYLRSHFNLVELADPQCDDIAGDVVAALHRKGCWEAMPAFWRKHRRSEDRFIFEARCLAEVPTPFKKIAERLGPGWTEAAVRVRYHRVVREIRRYLTKLGRLDEPE
jgi:hypothetical protein